jgi:UDP:flavonoid glycosyltransferase YjiC (YdhE family)
MHFVVSPFGSDGDVHPLLALALALRGRGHEVTFLTNEHFGGLARRFGVEFQPLGSDADFQALTGDPNMWRPLRACQHAFRRGVMPLMRDHYQILLQHQRQRPTVAISSVAGFGARVAQERYQLPVVTVDLQPAAIPSDLNTPAFPGASSIPWIRRKQLQFAERVLIDRTILPPLNAWRSELGLPSVRRVTRWWHSPWSVVCLFPSWYAAASADWPQNLVQADFPLWDERTDATLPPEITAFLKDGEAPIAFTPGSANRFARSFFIAAIEACRRLGRRGLLLTKYAEQLPRVLPDGILHVRYAPFSLLLPHVAGIVHHGGIGTTAQAMAAGIPQLIVALAYDQFDNAERVRRLKVGDALNQYRVTGRRLTERLESLLKNPSIQSACRHVAERFHRRDGAAAAAELIEQRCRVA